VSVHAAVRAHWRHISPQWQAWDWTSLNFLEVSLLTLSMFLFYCWVNTVNISLYCDNQRFPLLWQSTFPFTVAINVSLYCGNQRFPWLWQSKFPLNMAINVSLDCGNQCFSWLWQSTFLLTVAINVSLDCGNQRFPWLWQSTFPLTVAINVSFDCGNQRFPWLCNCDLNQPILATFNTTKQSIEEMLL
jgi:hypothetical protein